MGGGSFSYQNYASKSASLRSAPKEKVLGASRCDPTFDPKNITTRESLNSVTNPQATPMIIGLDVTGSMGDIAIELLRNGVGRTVEGILANESITDPQILFAAVGDSKCDRNPLQVTQFEADNRMVDQLQLIWNEGGGGANGGESYHLPWIFASRMVSADAHREGRKGYIITVGDEPVHHYTSDEEIRRTFGRSFYEGTVKTPDVYAEVCKNWYVFHISLYPQVRNSFSFMEDHFINLSDYHFLPEVVAAIIHLNEGNTNVDTLISECSNPALRVVYERAFV